MPLGYDGQSEDTETGFISLRARYYDPATDRFTTVLPSRRRRSRSTMRAMIRRTLAIPLGCAASFTWRRASLGRYVQRPTRSTGPNNI